MRISDWSSDVCSSDLKAGSGRQRIAGGHPARPQVERRWRAQAACDLLRGLGADGPVDHRDPAAVVLTAVRMSRTAFDPVYDDLPRVLPIFPLEGVLLLPGGRLPLNIFEPRYLAMFDAELASNRLIGMIQPRSEEHTSELQSLMRISFAVFCLEKKK